MHDPSATDPNILPTGDAVPERTEAAIRVITQHDLAFRGAVQARLTDVVLRLRGAWKSGPALVWGDIHTVDEDALGDFEKRIALTLREGFFNFSQLLCGLEVLLLELHETGIVNEQTLLGVEKLVVHRNHHIRQLAAISGSQSALPNFNSRTDCTGGSGNQSEVHSNPLVVDKCCLRASDSTACGDICRGEGGAHGESRDR